MATSSSSSFKEVQCQSHRPMGRSGHRMASDGRYLYVVGGYNPRFLEEAGEPTDGAEQQVQDALLKQIWVFNLLTERWTRISTPGFFPNEVASFAMCPDKTFSYLIMFGGTCFPFGSSSTNKTRLYHLRGRDRFRWKAVTAAGEVPAAGYGQSINCMEDGSYCVIGGTTGFEYNMRVSRMRLKFSSEQSKGMVISSTQTRDNQHSCGIVAEWETLKENDRSVMARYRHETVDYGQRIFVLGGGTRDEVVDFTQIDTFSLLTNKWEKMDTFPDSSHGFPAGRRCHSVVRDGQLAYVLGGCRGPQLPPLLPEDQDEANILQLFDDMWILNLDSLEWRKHAAKLKEPVFFHAAALTPEGCVYVHGGVTDQYAEIRSNMLQRIWLRPPHLQTLAVKTLLNSHPNLLNCTKRELRRIGIPHCFISWILGEDIADAPA